MPEPIREAKIAEPASPLGYRSGIDDRRQRRRNPDLDSRATRVILFLAAIPSGLFVAVGVHVLLVGMLAAIPNARLSLFFAANFVVFLAECALVIHVLRPPKKRGASFYLGFIAGAMLPSAGSTAVLFLEVWGR